jgi:formylglycine-generating enzyme required for sulfatase activity
MDPSRLTIDCGGGVRMRLIRLKRGKFLIGSPSGEAGRGSDEGPQVTVEISKTFYIGVTEVIQKQYSAVMGANPSAVKGPNHPAENVSPADALAFCRKLSALTSRKVRLPTEAEWEYACRAGSATAFCFGNDAAGLGAYAWTGLNSAVNKKHQPHAVAGKKANAWGLFDMHGNVRELVLSPYRSSSYSGAGTIAAQDPAVCRSTLQARGGSAGRDQSFCRSANRAFGSTAGDPFTGFRVVIELKQAASR